MLICPRCGKTSDEKGFIDAFCVDCYEFRLRLPRGIRIGVCKRCGRMELQGKWQQMNRKKISEYIAGKCKGDFTGAEYDPDLGVCSFTFEKGGKQVTVQRPIDAEKETTMCPDCNRSSGGYFEAIVQLRGDAEKVERQAQRLVKQLTRKTFISKVEEMHGGLDLYIGSSKATAAILQEMGFKPTVSRKLFGKREGKNLYRVTYAIRA